MERFPAEGMVVMAECAGGAHPDKTHALCHRARALAAVVLVIHRRHGTADVTLACRGGLSAHVQARLGDLISLYRLAGWGEGGAAPTLAEFSDLPVRVIPTVVGDLVGVLVEANTDLNPQ